MLNYLKIKMSSQKAVGRLSFMCLHNLCGYLHPDGCPLPMNKCFHHYWSVGLEKKICTLAHLKTCFFNIKGNLNNNNKPTLVFCWDRYLNMKGITTGDGNSQRDFCAVLRKHFEESHKH